MQTDDEIQLVWESIERLEYEATMPTPRGLRAVAMLKHLNGLHKQRDWEYYRHAFTATVRGMVMGGHDCTEVERHTLFLMSN